eukprot:3738679-Amphidinium_carterae.1
MKGVTEVITDRDLSVPEEPKAGSRSMTKAQINAAIDFINVHGKTGVGNNESMRWAYCELHDPASPLFRLPLGFVKEALNNKKSV